MAGSTGFEPATSGLTVQCANQAAPRARGSLRYTGGRTLVHPAAALERPAAAPSAAAAGRAAARDAAAAAPARGEDRRLGAARERREVALEAHEREAVVPAIPGGVGHPEPLEAVHPPLAHAERDRPREIAVQRVGGHARETVLLRAL